MKPVNDVWIPKDEVIRRLCKLATRVAVQLYHSHAAADCFCGQSDPARAVALVLIGYRLDDYRFDECVMQFIEEAVASALKVEESLAETQA